MEHLVTGPPDRSEGPTPAQFACQISPLTRHGSLGKTAAVTRVALKLKRHSFTVTLTEPRCACYGYSMATNVALELWPFNCHRPVGAINNPAHCPWHGRLLVCLLLV
ncbi:hypothetical protein SKAU_G00410270 [Synaphobranchus kaupii]|uniref:Uncharacterized protein n=1 Tax=Synaphobranchus kaupii TaxID=118154 RepID=A0A9Q1E7L8_SYNKA|nr:hypothetical protein SKAU_G00410270 [Synaphobranchus kaupii]